MSEQQFNEGKYSVLQMLEEANDIVENQPEGKAVIIGIVDTNNEKADGAIYGEVRGKEALDLLELINRARNALLEAAIRTIVGSTDD